MAMPNKEDGSGTAGEQERRDVHGESYADEKAGAEVTQVQTSSIALAAAIAAQKPSLLSKNMLKLYFIMSIGYLVSTMNGFGEHPPSLRQLDSSDGNRLFSHGCY